MDTPPGEPSPQPSPRGRGRPRPPKNVDEAWIRWGQDDRNHPLYPAPSVMWDWEKIDIGLRLGVLEEIDLTLEWNDNTFVRAGRDESADELLATLRVEMDRGFG